MNDADFKFVLDHAQGAKDSFRYWLNLLGVSTLMGGCAAILSEDMRSLRGFLRCTTLGVGAAYLVGAVLQDSGINEGYIHCMVGLSALYANYILIFLLKVIKSIMNNPRDLIDSILDRIFGQVKK